VLGVEPSGLWLGDLPRFVLCDDCLVSRPDSVGKSESQIMAKVSVEGCKEIAEFYDCLRCHVFLFGWLVLRCLLATRETWRKISALPTKKCEKVKIPELPA
jgi:hypothetical protein